MRKSYGNLFTYNLLYELNTMTLETAFRTRTRKTTVQHAGEEMIIDLFAGGGGASTGIKAALGRSPDVAINHNIEAVAMHLANHPETIHYVSDVFEVDPLKVVGNRRVGLLWASPDCKHFSKAKGGKPVSKKIRGLAWVVIKWAKLVRPRVIFLENVEEFQTWGPLGPDNMPCPKRKGRTFERWKRSLEALGYKVDFREDRASDFGTPTIRKRLFLVARCDGLPIIFPEPTHAKIDSLAVTHGFLKPWNSAANCMEWDIDAPSIFQRKRPLADATNRRIAKGIMRYVVNAAQPFIVPHQGEDCTQAGANRGEKAMIIPSLVQTGYGEREGQAPRALDLQLPLGTVVGTQKHALVTAFLNEHAQASNQRVMPIDEPLRTQMAEVKGGHFSVVAASLVKHYTGVDEPAAATGSSKADSVLNFANLVHMGHGEQANGAKRWSHGVRDITDPLNTITASGMPAALITSVWTDTAISKTEETGPVTGTGSQALVVSAQGTHHAEVRAFLVKYYGTDQDPKLTEPLHTVTTKDRFGLVTVKGQQYEIADIGLRMLTPRELFRAQGFSDDYIITWGIHPFDGTKIKLTKTAAVRMCGNSVCPQMAEAYVAANYGNAQTLKKAA